jgi:hypothetical protein
METNEMHRMIFLYLQEKKFSQPTHFLKVYS